MCYIYSLLRYLYYIYWTEFLTWAGSAEFVETSAGSAPHDVFTTCSDFALFSGEMTVMYLFTRYRFNWNEVDYSIFSTYSMMTNLIGKHTHVTSTVLILILVSFCFLRLYSFVIIYSIAKSVELIIRRTLWLSLILHILIPMFYKCYSIIFSLLYCFST